MNLNLYGVNVQHPLDKVVKGFVPTLSKIAIFYHIVTFTYRCTGSLLLYAAINLICSLN